jgi:Fe-S-cluster-containing dehydrogenase component
MSRYGIAVDIDKCTGCYACFLACKDEYSGNDHLPLSVAQPETGHNWLTIKEVEQGTGTKLKVDYIPLTCQHCENPLCATVAPDGAVYCREDGIVIIDPVKAKGCKEIVNACPYHVVTWNEDLDVAQKCTMCAHMLDSGETTTRCAEVCPTGALVFGDLDDKNSEVSKMLAEKADKVEDYKPEFGTDPVMKYIGLPKFFIAGEVVLSDKKDECPRGLNVTLCLADESKTVVTTTDMFGDFEFKNLEQNKEYTVKVELDGYLPAEATVRTYASANVGELVLQAK